MNVFKQNTRNRYAVLCTVAVVVMAIVGCTGYFSFFAPTHILVVNALPAQAAEIALNNDSRFIKVTAVDSEQAHRFAKYDAILMFGRGLYLDEAQTAELEQAAAKVIPVFTFAFRNYNLDVVRNLDATQRQTLYEYVKNPSGPNWRNMLRYLRAAATPHRVGDKEFLPPVATPHNTYYHREYGRYFPTDKALETYLEKKGLYHPGGDKIALISGVTFPVEGNRAHVDTLIDRLTRQGFNVYPLSASGSVRDTMLCTLRPHAIVYMPMGRLGNDELIEWTVRNNIPLFMPFPMIQSHDEWADPEKPVSGGVLNARVVIPEIDGSIAPFCIATQNANDDGYLVYTVENERMNTFVDYVRRYMALRHIPNSRKRIAVCYFRSPGKDALLASGMEVVPSLYAFLCRLRDEGYDVSGLPSTVEAFGRLMNREGFIPGTYALGVQRDLLRSGHPERISAEQYRNWVSEDLLPEKYEEVVRRYGPPPGHIMSDGDDMVIPRLRFGNILLFPQPRPAIGDDEFKLQHGVDVAPPHNYIASYLYLRHQFDADALVHFGTHGNLEFTPGKNAALSSSDWSDVLVGPLPHFYFYTTGNVGEGIIARRRTRAALVTHLTPPYVESGMRRQYQTLLNDIHEALASGDRTEYIRVSKKICQEAAAAGLLRDLGIDSLKQGLLEPEELQRLDAYTEEIANEKITGAYYTLGTPYTDRDLATTVTAIAADGLAYAAAQADRDKGRITTDRLHDYSFVAHRYLPAAKQRIAAALKNPSAVTDKELVSVLQLRDRLKASSRNELDAMLHALSGGCIPASPGGDPVRNPNVLPTGRNMYSVNAETAPDERAWEQGVRLARSTLDNYLSRHGEYPVKVGYTFWAGEFIATSGATLAQVFYMLGVEPVRDGQGRVVDLRLIPGNELGRPRIDVTVQVSGQLRDIAASRLKLITQAVRLAAEAPDDTFPNYVAEGSLRQEKSLVEHGAAPRQARELSVMRVFGPVNSGYSTGIIPYVDNSGAWDDSAEIVQGYLQNMGAVYGDDDNWGEVFEGLFASAIDGTQAIVQPRQSNTWGPLSLDHVYEFTGAYSLAVKSLSGQEPDACMADYRNPFNSRIQDVREAVAVEARSTVLNPVFIRERMKGGAGSAEMFGKIFRNVFGWNVTRSSALDSRLYDDLYATYIEDCHLLGIHDFFAANNPAALQTITAVMLESQRKGYWQATDGQLRNLLRLHTRITLEYGAACTRFVCGNQKLQHYIASQLESGQKEEYTAALDAVYRNGAGKEMVLEEHAAGKNRPTDIPDKETAGKIWIAVAAGMLLLAVVWVRKRR